MSFKKRLFPEGVLYARIDQLTSYQDYYPYELCLRLICVTPDTYSSAAYNGPNGCQTFLLDVNLRGGSGMAAVSRLIQYRPFSDFHIGYDLSTELGEPPRPVWLRVEIRHTASNDHGSYGYALFQSAAPTYVEILSIASMQGGVPLAPVAYTNPTGLIEVHAPSEPQELVSFHVGQGMCSALQCNGLSYLFDAGAGTPVKREAYDAKVHAHSGPFNSDLLSTLHGKVEMILSHPDSDHWRLLDWEPTLLGRIGNIYVPDNVADLVLSDSSIKPYIVPTRELQVRSPAGTVFLQAHRSDPKTDDSNGQCLVSVVNIGGRRALLPGDYVYERMLVDANPAVRQLAASRYDAIVVPHHGDKRSADSVVAPTTPYVSRAFFSAGNHLGYHHPRAESLTSHNNMHFEVISKKWIDDIISFRLL